MNAKYSKGFTLTEILITLGIIGILAALTVRYIGTGTNDPSKGQSAGDVNAIFTSLLSARMDAASTERPVSICAASSATRCADSSAGVFNWHNGWLVFRDEGVPGVIDGEDQIYSIHDALDGALRITGDVGFMRFDQIGRSTHTGQLSIRHSAAKAAVPLRIAVERSGLTKLLKS